MVLPDNFQFSQASLQDFSDCRRRFQLRHIMRLSWPAIETEPVLENERFIQRGARFHHLVHQYLLGIPVDRLTVLASSDDLAGWWENFLNHIPVWDLPGGTRYAELRFSCRLGDHRLVAQYDLVMILPGERAVIVDWKTSRKRPLRTWLAERLQSRVYPYLLVVGGDQLNLGQSLEPEQLEMIYWFAEDPAAVERFSYSREKFQADGKVLLAMVALIQRLSAAEFFLSDDLRHCRYCIYRSLCDRGTQAGISEEWAGRAETETAVEEIKLDLEQIAEIEF